MQETIKTKILDKINNLFKENSIFHDAFKHGKGKNPELALIGDKLLDFLLYQKLFYEDESITKGMMDNLRQKYFSRKNHYRIYKILNLDLLRIQVDIPLSQATNETIADTIFEAIFGAFYLIKNMEDTKILFEDTINLIKQEGWEISEEILTEILPPPKFSLLDDNITLEREDINKAEIFKHSQNESLINWAIKKAVIDNEPATMIYKLSSMLEEVSKTFYYCMLDDEYLALLHVKLGNEIFIAIGHSKESKNQAKNCAALKFIKSSNLYKWLSKFD